MKAINKLNESLKYRIDINNRNVVAAICVQEFYKLRNYVNNQIEDEMLNRLIWLAKNEMNSKIPMKLSLIKNIMPAYKLNNGNPCRMKMCDCTCNPSDGSITIAKLAQETIEWVMEKESPNPIPSVTPVLHVTWKNKRNGMISTELNIDAEIGDTYEWSGYYVWNSEEGYSNPYKVTSNVFNVLTKDGIPSDTEIRTVSENSLFGVTLHSLSGTQAAVTSGIKFNIPVYYGIAGSILNKMLSSSNESTIMVNTNEDEYFVYKYPIDQPKLESIIMDGALNVLQAFDYSEEVFITDTGISTKLRVYTSANPGAFTNVKLSFK